MPDWTFEPILPTIVERSEQFIAESVAKSEPFLLYLPLTSPHTPISPNKEWQGKSGLNHHYADLVMETDAMVGRIIDAVNKTGIEENTIIFFASDKAFFSSAGMHTLNMLFLSAWPGHSFPTLLTVCWAL